MPEEPILDTENQPHVRGFLQRPEKSKAGIVLTHGAGGNCQAPLLVALSRAFAEAGYAVLRCDLPFRQQRPYGPPSAGAAAQDQAGIIRAAEVLRRLVPGEIFVGGQSYGGRQATMAAANHPGFAAGLLLLSYPLHPPGKPAQQRTKHFPQLQAPALFVQGTKDPFASPQEIEAAIQLLPGRKSLALMDGAGHDLGYGRKKADPAVVTAILGRFLSFFEPQSG